MGIEAGAGLTLVIVVVAMDITAVYLDEIVDEFCEGGFLSFCPGVSRLPILLAATDVAYPDGMGIMAIAVGTSPRDEPTFLDCAVEPDNIVISDILPAITMGRRCSMPLADFLSTDIDFWFCV